MSPKLALNPLWEVKLYHARGSQATTLPHRVQGVVKASLMLSGPNSGLKMKLQQRHWERGGVVGSKCELLLGNVQAHNHDTNPQPPTSEFSLGDHFSHQREWVDLHPISSLGSWFSSALNKLAYSLEKKGLRD